MRFTCCHIEISISDISLLILALVVLDFSSMCRVTHYDYCTPVLIPPYQPLEDKVEHCAKFKELLSWARQHMHGAEEQAHSHLRGKFLTSCKCKEGNSHADSYSKPIIEIVHVNTVRVDGTCIPDSSKCIRDMIPGLSRITRT